MYFVNDINDNINKFTLDTLFKTGLNFKMDDFHYRYNIVKKLSEQVYIIEETIDFIEDDSLICNHLYLFDISTFTVINEVSFDLNNKDEIIYELIEKSSYISPKLQQEINKMNSI
jgi:hypothetical protein